MKSIQLAGDIGGTKTTLALIDPEGEPRVFLEKTSFPSGEYASLEAVVADFLKDKDWQVSQASFGVAGPVANGRAQITNLPWLIDAADLGQQFGFPFRLLNDLEAIAHAVPSLAGADLETLNPGTNEGRGALAVVANHAAGIGESAQAISLDAIGVVMNLAMERVRRILAACLRASAASAVDAAVGSAAAASPSALTGKTAAP